MTEGEFSLFRSTDQRTVINTFLWWNDGAFCYGIIGNDRIKDNWFHSVGGHLYFTFNSCTQTDRGTSPTMKTSVLIPRSTNTPFIFRDSMEAQATHWRIPECAPLGITEEWNSPLRIPTTTKVRRETAPGSSKQDGGSTAVGIPVLLVHTAGKALIGRVWVTWIRWAIWKQRGWWWWWWWNAIVQKLNSQRLFEMGCLARSELSVCGRSCR